jgi:hypothetical protein
MANADFYRTKPLAEWDVPKWNSFAQETLRPRLRAELGWDDGGEEAGAGGESGGAPPEDPARRMLHEYLYHKLKGEGDPAAAGTYDEFVEKGLPEWRIRSEQRLDEFWEKVANESRQKEEVRDPPSEEGLAPEPAPGECQTAEEALLGGASDGPPRLGTPHSTAAVE